MSLHKFSPVVVSIQSTRTARRRPRAGLSSAWRTRRSFAVLHKGATLVVGIALSMALSGCGVFCGFAGGTGGFGGNCGVGFHF